LLGNRNLAIRIKEVVSEIEKQEISDLLYALAFSIEQWCCARCSDQKRKEIGVAAFDGLVKNLSENPQQRSAFIADLSGVLQRHGVDIGNQSLQDSLQGRQIGVATLEPGLQASTIVITSSHTIGGQENAEGILLTTGHTVGDTASTIVITSSHTIGGENFTEGPITSGPI
jgi:hypothetical protein